ncbi:chromate transporter [Rubrivivax gelatinosus]|uniref:chromate efflux transporter n=1 Tax=Rubrivivax gelatinosus TaxID=28068 RepID=UPI0018CA212A|nr:chromate efflux transporter [Rubrivivax gelatinosus]MBG6082113.1 chromate transporter [Rubrivivax gelatinosus]
MNAAPADPPPAPVPLRSAFGWWLRLGCISFGGPAGQIALMHEELVVRRRWISERRFLHALNYCMLLPGPEAQQLATYIGWLMHRTPGALVAGTLFVLPSALLLMLLAWAYLGYGQLPAVAAALWGVKPAVTALVLAAAVRIGGRTLGHPLRWAIAAAAFVALAAFSLPFPAVVAAAALAGAIGAHFVPQAFGLALHGEAPPAPHAPALIDDDTPPPVHARGGWPQLLKVTLACVALWVAALGVLVLVAGPGSTPAQMGLFFTKAALLSFGGAYAVLPYVFQAAVGQYGWLTAAQTLDGLALGETTPGPLIIVVVFVGFVGGWTQPAFGADSAAASAVLAAATAAFFTFLPSFWFILAGGPLIEATHGRPRFTAPLAGVSAAVVGVIANLALFFAWHVLWPRGWAGGPDLAALAVGVAAALALLRWRVGPIPVIAAAAAAGLAWQTLR